MKMILLTVLFASSINVIVASECPKLTGSYPTCTGAFIFKISDVKIKQSELGGIQHYEYTDNINFEATAQGSMNFIADEKTYLYEENSTKVNVTSSCLNGVLTTHIDLSIGDTFDMEMKREFSLDKDSNLLIKDYNDEDEYDVVVCKRN